MCMFLLTNNFLCYFRYDLSEKVWHQHNRLFSIFLIFSQMSMYLSKFMYNVLAHVNINMAEYMSGLEEMENWPVGNNLNIGFQHQSASYYNTQQPGQTEFDRTFCLSKFFIH